jgi:hypothetical protein
MVLYAFMCCVYVFSFHRDSPDMILGDEPLILGGSITLDQILHNIF